MAGVCGCASPGKPAVKGGARLFRVDLASDEIICICDLGSATDGTSYVDDARFHGGLACQTDAGKPGPIVMDLATLARLVACWKPIRPRPSAAH